MRLNIFIAKSGFCSRRKAGELIKSGEVHVNGVRVLEPWHELADGDDVRAGGRRVGVEAAAYLVLNKPAGVTTTLSDRFAARKITDLIPEKYGRVYPVGRLDKNSRGLIILTNDGDLCYRLTHPKFGIEKEYIVTVRGRLGAMQMQRLKKGIRDGDDLLAIRSAVLERSTNEMTVVRVVAVEGKKRHLRRLFKGVGARVADLERVRVGGLSLEGLKEGAFREVDKEVVMRLTLAQPR